MNPTRRGFLAALAAGFVIDPERLLWVPGKKLISIPKPRHRRGSGILTSDVILDEAMKLYSLTSQLMKRGDDLYFTAFSERRFNTSLRTNRRGSGDS
jgi:hypothetical protein